MFVRCFWVWSILSILISSTLAHSEESTREGTAVSLTVICYPPGTGEVTGGGAVDPGQGPFAISAIPADGFIFSHWTSTAGTIANVGLQDTTVDNLDQDTTVTAHFCRRIPMIASEWSKLNSGALSVNDEGLKINGSGYRLGNRLFSKQLFDFAGTDTFLKFKVYGNDNYCSFGANLFAVASHSSFTTHHSYSGSKVITDGIWYFVHIRVEADGSYRTVTTTGDYDVRGGTAFNERTGTASETWGFMLKRAPVQFFLSDSYGSTSAYIMAGEVLTTAQPLLLLQAVVYDFEDGQVPPGFAVTDNVIVTDVANGGKALLLPDEAGEMFQFPTSNGIACEINCRPTYNSASNTSFSSALFSPNGENDLLWFKGDDYRSIVLPLDPAFDQARFTARPGSAGGAGLYVDSIVLLSESQLLSTILSPRDNSWNSPDVLIEGTAAAIAGVKRVEVSTDGGNTWQVASGTTAWSYEWSALADGKYELASRVIDMNDNVEAPSRTVHVVIESEISNASGTITSDQTWSGLVQVNGDVTVPAGVTLTIAPGTRVSFASNADSQAGGFYSDKSEIVVEGSLIANGDGVNPITFTSSAELPAKGDWGGISADWGVGVKQLTLNHCQIEYAQNGVYWRAKEGYHQSTISNTIISQCSGQGYRLDASGGVQVNLELNGCEIRNCGGWGIYCYNKDEGSVVTGKITGCNLLDNGHGVYLYSREKAVNSFQIEGNEINGRDGYGIYAYTYYGYNFASDYNICKNIIRNSSKGIYCRSYYGQMTGSILDNEISSNTTGIECYLEKGDYPLTALMGGNFIHGNSATGIYAHSERSGTIYASIAGNNIENNGGNGIESSYSSYYDSGVEASFTLNRVVGNGGYGVLCRTSKAIDFLYNEIQGNGDTGVHLQASHGSKVLFNNLYGNSGNYEFVNGNSALISARNNFWGAETTAEINLNANPKNIVRIYDIFDDSAKGRVDYSAWLEDLIALPDNAISVITSPIADSQFNTNELRVQGIAAAVHGIKRVEISFDNGVTWDEVSGTTRWHYDWTVPGDGEYTILSRVTDNDDRIEIPTAAISFSIDSSLPTNSGTLTSNEIWSDTVVLTGDVTVPASTVLTIEPGTQILAQALSDDRSGGINKDRIELIVAGSLSAIGTSEQPIVFSSTSANPAAGDWYGIRAEPGIVNGGVDLQHCTVVNGVKGVYAQCSAFPGTVRLRDCVFSDHSAEGVRVDTSGGLQTELDLNGCEIRNCNGWGIYCYTNDEGTVLNGSINSCRLSDIGHGIYLYSREKAVNSLQIKSNEINGTGGYGIYARTEYCHSLTSNYEITDNTVTNSSKGIYCYSYFGEMTGNILDNEISDSEAGIECYLERSNDPLTVLLGGNFIHNNSGKGIYVYSYRYGTLRARITGNNIENNGGNGIESSFNSNYSSGLETSLTLNRVLGNGGYGVLCRASKPVDFLYNEIRSNSGSGLYLQASSGSKVIFNNLSENLGDHELVNGNSAVISARNNYWGAETTAEMDIGGNPKNIARIYDFYDDSGKGKIDYGDWTHAAPIFPRNSVSTITSPPTGSCLKTSELRISGFAAASSGVKQVEVSFDNGANWQQATGTTSWYYDWTVPGDGDYILLSRVIDNSDQIEIPGAGVSVTIDSSLPTTSGFLSDDETWSETVVLTGDVTVPAGSTLTIEPGTRIMATAFNDDRSSGANPDRVELIIEGTLAAIGTSESPIEFCSTSANPAAGDWYGIRSTPGADNSEVTLQHCRVTNGIRGIFVQNSNFSDTCSISNTIFQNHNAEGVRLDITGGGQAQLSINNCEVRNCGGWGVYCYSKDEGSSLSGSISVCTLSDNAHGMYLYSREKAVNSLQIKGNDINGKSGYGIYARTHDNYSFTSSYEIIENTINSSSKGVYCYSYYGGITAKILDNEISSSTTGIECYLEKGDYPLTVLLGGNFIHDNSGTGFYAHSDRSGTIYADITGNSIENNGGHGFESSYSSYYDSGVETSFTLNRIVGNGGCGVLCRASKPVDFLYNQVRDNSNSGLYLTAPHGSNVLFNNLFSNLGDHELLNAGQIVNARNNYWGSETTAEMNLGNNPKNILRIHDLYDAADKGRADYGEWKNNALADFGNMISTIISPVDQSHFKTSELRVQGVAAALHGVKRVEISFDDGTTWHEASGTTRWYYDWTVPGDGDYTLLSRVIDTDNVVSIPAPVTSITIDSSLATTTGTLSGNETWSGTVLLTGDVTVPASTTLTIEPGTEILAEAFCDDRSGGADQNKIELIIEGTLFAYGASDQPITFSSTSNKPAAGDWYGIRLVNSDTASSLQLQNCKVAHAIRGVYAQISGSECYLSVKNSVFEDHLAKGIRIDTYAAAQAELELKDCEIRNCRSWGVYCYTKDLNSSLSGRISGCTFSDNGHGMYLYSRDKAVNSLEIKGNDINGKGGYGIYTRTNWCYNIPSDYNVYENTINNSSKGIYCHSYYSKVTAKVLDNEIRDCATGIDCYLERSHDPLTVLLGGNFIHANSGTGIYAHSERYGTLYAKITGNHIENNGGNGIECSYSTSNDSQLEASFTLNHVIGNSGQGVYCTASKPVDFVYNNINSNGDTGLYIRANSGSNVLFNNLYGNSGDYELVNGNGAAISAQNNYWGTETIAEMNSGNNPKNIMRIYDIYDDSSRGTVDYGQWNENAYLQGDDILSTITTPAADSSLKTTALRISGTAASRYGVKRVEVSVDGGINWLEATGTTSWHHDWSVPGDGDYTLLSRVIDNADRLETPKPGTRVKINSFLPTTSGALSDDESWSGTVVLTGDVTVPAGTTLNIQPGTQIFATAFKDDREAGLDTSKIELTVEGSLAVAGTAEQPVVFSSTSGNPAPGDWYGIRLNPDGKSGTLTLQHCTVEYGVRGVYASSSSSAFGGQVSAEDSVFRNNSAEGIRVEFWGGRQAQLDLSNCEVRNCGGWGILCYTKNAGSLLNGNISGCTLSDNAHGIYIYGRDNGVNTFNISSNSIDGNGGYGIYARTYICEDVASEISIQSNNIQNSSKGIYCHSYYGEMTTEILENEITGSATGIECYLERSRDPLTVLLGNNFIHQNSGRGFYAHSERYGTLHAKIAGNNIENNGGNGIECSYDSNYSAGLEVCLLFNRITGNGGKGIYCQASAPVNAQYNSIFLNSGLAFDNGSGVPVDARNCWWGNGGLLEMASAGSTGNISIIQDVFDNSGLGLVNYTSWLTSEPSTSTGPVSRVTSPVSQEVINSPESIEIEAIAWSIDGIESVEISIDNGITWMPAVLDSVDSSRWRAVTDTPADGALFIQSRAVDALGVVETPGSGVEINIDRSALTTAGTLVQNETWSGTVLLKGDVTVPEGLSLTVLPGTTVVAPVLFDDTLSGNDSARTELIVHGTLLVEGSAEQPVLFTLEDKPGRNAGDWRGIYSDGQVRLNHTIVEYASTGLYHSPADEDDILVARDCEFRDNAGQGIDIRLYKGFQTQATVTDSSILRNGGHGIYSRVQATGGDLQAVFSSNILSGNAAHGICCVSDGSADGFFTATVSGNEISDSGSDGIYCYTRYGAYGSWVIDRNQISGSERGVYVEYYDKDASVGNFVKVNQNIVEANRQQGISITSDDYPLDLEITQNVLRKNADYALKYSGISSPLISSNEVTENGAGIYCNVQDVFSLTGNSIFLNNGYALYNDSGKDINAQSNWWGVTTTNEMKTLGTSANISSLFDSEDNSAKGTIDYSGWITVYEAPPAPGVDPVENPTAANSVLLSGTKTSGTAVLINGNVAVPSNPDETWNFELGLSEGENPISIWLRNSVGLVSDTVYLNVVRDTTPPVIYLSSPANHACLKEPVSSITVTLLESETAIAPDLTLANAVVLLEGQTVAGDWSINQNILTFTPQTALLEGNYQVVLTPVDSPLGNSQQQQIDFTVDLSKPSAPTVVSVPSVTATPQLFLSGTRAGDAALWLNTSVIATADGNTGWEANVSLLSGTHTYRLFSVDAAGNFSDETLFTITLDTHAPVLRDITPTDGVFINFGPPQLSFSFEEDFSELILLTSTVIDAGGNEVNGTWLVDGTTVFFEPAVGFGESAFATELRVRDAAGNETLVNSTFEIDVTPPSVPTLEPVDSPTGLGTQFLSGTKESGSGIKLNGKIVVPVSDNTDWQFQATLKDGMNALQLEAYDRAGNQSDPVHAVIEYDDTAPPPVSTLVLDNTGPGDTLTLNWTGYDESAAGDVGGYRIFINEELFTQTAELAYSAIVTAGNFTYIADNLISEKTYYCAVVAVDARGNALSSVTPVSAAPVDTEPPAEVADLTVDCAATQLTLHWTAPAGNSAEVANYRVYLAENATPVELPAEQLSYEISSLTPATSYLCRVSTVDANGNESEGLEIEGVTLLPHPEGLLIEPHTDYLRLSWNATPYPNLLAGYRVYVEQDSFSDISQLDHVEQTSDLTAIVEGLMPDSTYHVAVSAVNLAGGEDADLVSQPAQTLAAPNLVVSSLNAVDSTAIGNELNIEWTVVNIGDGATEYNWSDLVCISSDDQVGDDIELVQSEQSGLLPGEQCVNNSVAVVPNIRPGQYWLIARTDVGDALVESIENDNSFIYGPITIDGPDFTPVNLEYSPAAIRDVDKVTVTADIVNSGTATEVPMEVIFKVDTVVAATRVLENGLAAGQSLPVTFDWAAKPGVHRLTVVTDPANEQWEADENNNVAEIVLPEVLDETAPEIIELAPSDGTRMHTGTNLAVTASDNAAVVAITFYESTDAEDWQVIPNEGEPNVDWDTSGLADGTWFVKVVVADAAGNTAEVVQSYEVDHTPPAAVTLKGIAGEFSSDLSWSKAPETDFGYYRLFRSTTAGGLFEPINGALSSETFSDRNVQVGTAYYYVVRVLDQLGNQSAVSNEVQVIPLDDISAPIITQFLPENAETADKLDLQVQAEDNVAVAGTRLEHSFDKENWELIQEGEANLEFSWDVSALPHGTVSVRASAWDAQGNMTQALHEYMINHDPPPVPDNVRALGDELRIVIAWDPVNCSDFSHYEISRSTGGDYRVIHPKTTSTVVYDTRVAAGIEYKYRVVAIDRFGNRSNPSAEAAGTMQGDSTPPIVLSVAAENGDEVNDMATVVATARDNGVITDVAFAFSASGADAWESISTPKTPVTSDGIYTAKVLWDTSQLTEGVYDIRATVTDEGGNVGSYTGSVTVDHTAPQSPGTAIITDAQCGGTLVVQWESVADAGLDRYWIYRRADNEAEVLKIGESLVPEWVDEGLTNGHVYHYSVAAVDNAGNVSPPSQEIAGTPSSLLDPSISNLALLPEIPVLGREAKIKVSLQNLGPATADALLRISLAGEDAILYENVITIEGDGQHEVVANWTPQSADFKTIHAHVEALNDADLTNNTAELETPVNHAPVAVADVEQLVDWNSSATFDAGKSTDRDGVIKSYYWDFGDSTDAQVKTAVHAYKSPGTYTVTLRVTDDRGASTVAEQQVTVQDTRSDLVVTDIEWNPTEPREKDEVQIRATVANVGNGPSQKGFFVAYYIDGRYAGYATVSESIAAGETASVSFNWIATKGLHTVRIVADDIQKSIQEIDESNNAAERALTLQQIYFPDLQVVSLSSDVSDGIVSSEKLLQANALIVNGGDADAEDFWVSLYLDDELVQRQHVATLSVNEELSLIFNYPPRAGTHVLKAVADNPVSLVHESDEANNECINALPTLELAYPDVAVTSLNIGPDERVVSMGTSFDIQAQIANLGEADIERRILVHYYMDAAYVGAREIEGLTAGSQGLFAFQVPAVPGSHSFKVIVDPDAAIVESEEANNEADASVEEVQLLYPDLVVTDLEWQKSEFALGEDPLAIKFGDEVAFRVTVSNNTVVSTQNNFSVWLFVDGKRVAIQEVPVLGGKRSISFVMNWKADVNPDVDHIYEVVVNGNGRIPEEDATNNTYTVAPGSIDIADHFGLTAQMIGGRKMEFEDLRIFGWNQTASLSACIFQGSSPGSYLSPDDGVNVAMTIIQRGKLVADQDSGEIIQVPDQAIIENLPLSFNAITRNFTIDVPFISFESGGYSIRLTAGDGVVSMSKSWEILVLQKVNFTLAVDKTSYRRGEPVQITGTVTAADGTSVIGEDVILMIQKGKGIPGVVNPADMFNKTVSKLTAKTDNNGAFSCDFKPLHGDIGDFHIQAFVVEPVEGGTGYAEFDIQGLELTPERSRLVIPTNRPFSKTLTLRNPGSRAISNIHLELIDQDVNDNITATIDTADVGNLEPTAAVPVILKLDVPENAPDTASFRVIARTPDGYEAEAALAFSLKPAQPMPIFDPQKIEVALNPGGGLEKKVVVTNAGLGTLQGIKVIPPSNLPWISSTIDQETLKPGESAKLSINIASPESLALGIYSDQITITSENWAGSSQLWLQVEITSADRGVLSFVVDDDTGKLLDNAGIELVSDEEFVAQSGAQVRTYHNVFRQKTDSNGVANFANLPIGNYSCLIQAPGHESSKRDVLVMPLSKAVVEKVTLVATPLTYKWTVTPITIEDRYEIRLQMDFVAEVEKPQFAVLPPWITIPHEQEEGFADQIRIVNPSKIKLHDVKAEVVDANGVTLASEGVIGTMAAESSCTLAYHVAPGDYAFLKGGNSRIVVTAYYMVFDPKTYEWKESQPLTAIIPLANPAPRKAVVEMEEEEFEIHLPDAVGIVPERLELPAPSQSAETPALVEFELQQDATMEREGFAARLELDNGLTEPLTGLSIAPRVVDADGEDVTDRFFLTAPELTGIAAVNGSDNLGAYSSMSAEWVLIPGEGLGGKSLEGRSYWAYAIMSYYAAGRRKEVITEQVEIKVHPQPKVILHYFIPSKVHADVPFKLGVLAENEGYGEAHNLKILSGQPEIAGNEAGIALDLNIVGGSFGWQEGEAFTVAFGNVAPKSTAVGYWLLNSSVDGYFIGFSAELTHLAYKGIDINPLITDVTTEIIARDGLFPSEDNLDDAYTLVDRDDDGFPDYLINLFSGLRLDIQIPDNTEVVRSISDDDPTMEIYIPEQAGYVMCCDAGPGSGVQSAFCSSCN